MKLNDVAVRKTKPRAKLYKMADGAANSFEAIAREWFAKFSPQWAPSHADKIIRRLENDAFPWIGSKPIADITPPLLLAVIRRTETRGAPRILLTASSRIAGRYSAMPWRQGEQSVIHRRI